MKKKFKKIIIGAIVLAMVIPSVAFGAAANYGGNMLWDEEWYYRYSQPFDQVSVIYSGGFQGNLIGSDNGGSMASAMTRIKEMRREFPDSYLFDGGYFTGGENSYGIEAEQNYGLKALEVMSYDGALLGNGEFSYGTDKLVNYLKVAKAEADKSWGKVIYPSLLANNLDWKKINNKSLENRISDLSGGQQYSVIEKYGSRLAVFGLIEDNEKNQKQGIYALDCVETAKRIVKTIKKNEQYIDGIVCLYNGNDSSAIAQAAPGINLIVATSEENLNKGQSASVENVVPIKEGKTYIVETLGKDSIGQIILKKGTNQKLSLISCKNYKLDETVEKAKAILDVNYAYEDALDKTYFKEFGINHKTVLANNVVKFHNFDGLENNSLGDLIGDAYKYTGEKYGKGDQKVAASIFSTSTVEKPLSTGDITPKNTFEVFTKEAGEDGLAGIELMDVYLSGAELKILAEIDASISEDDKKVSLYSSGLVYEYNPNRFYRNRVSKVYIEDGDKKEAVEDRNLYRVITDAKTIKLIDNAQKAPFGLMDVSYKDKDGNQLENIKSAAIKTNQMDVKQWYAVEKYIEDKGISSHYREARMSKIANDDTSLKALLANPGKIFIVSLLASVIALALIILIVCTIIGIIRRALGIQNSEFIRKARKANKQKSIFSHRRNRYTRNMKYRKERRFGRKR